MKKKLIFLTGAGISAESGIPTFRDSDGLWEKHSIEDVATPDGWKRNKELVLEFYNGLRSKLKDYKPNRAHEVVKELEEHYDIMVVTQNVDDLHERAGVSKHKVIHMHGELLKSRSTVDQNLKYDCDGDIKVGDKCEKGSQLRPDIVWFHENVYHLSTATELIQECDVLVVVGTSLNVWPAAGLVYVTKDDAEIYCVDPADVVIEDDRVTHIKEKATVGMEQLKEILIKNKGNKKPCCW